ncbi:MAG: DUF1269 domain-containing protein [Anaerolineaceae bacterium]|nr:MAG: DUF1269 domain-containing protein [Anaerolineaceae bacterium]
MMNGDEKPYPTDYNVVAFVFDSKELAEGISEDVEANFMLDKYHIVAKSVVTKDENSEVHFHGPSGHGHQGAAAGFVTGGLLGLLGGPVGVLACSVGGAVVGGIAGHFHTGRSLHEEDMQAFGDALKPNSSAFLVLAGSADTDNVKLSMDGYHATVVTLPVGEELCAEIGAAVAAGYGKEGISGEEAADDA